VKKRLAFVLGIRPDVIRAALIVEKLRGFDDIEVVFVWSGQHYSDNLKSVFFRELDVAPEEIDLGCRGETDAEIVASVITRLEPVLRELRPEATVFLGDTNTTLGALAAAQLNIPIVHIEGCMRSYDWRMPEEKYRTTVDHLSDVIYAYFDEYREQGIREGLNPESIVVVGNPIVDVLERFFFERRERFDAMATPQFFASRGLRRGEYHLMTCHRRENVHDRAALEAILGLVEESARPVFFPASYRTQRVLGEGGWKLPPNLVMVDPIGYEELLCLLVNARAVFTDSGTVVEEACVLQVPSVQMRRSTERPQVYDARASVKFDPTGDAPGEVLARLERLVGTRWEHGLGDGRASERIADDLRRRMLEDGFSRHRPGDYHLPIARSYGRDGAS